MFKWFNKSKKGKTGSELIENVLNEAEKLNAFDEATESVQSGEISVTDDEAEPLQTTESFENTAHEEDSPAEEVREFAEDLNETADYIEDTVQEKKPKKGFFAKLKEGLSKTRDAIFGSLDGVFSAFKSVDEELFEELEETLIMADIGVDTSVFMIEQLRARAKEKHITAPLELKLELKNVISEILAWQDSSCHLEDSPSVIMVIGVNGVGKTTSIGKLAHFYKAQGKKVILAAADTFRAAAIDQLQIWAQRAGCEIVKHKEGSDPSAVVFDAIRAAKARGADIVICDTAGRLHNKKNLMDELSKTARVIERETGKPASEVLLVLDASTGQNALIQAKEFANAAKLTGVILTKLDGTAKGGVIIALSREQSIGVKFIGVGEGIDDLQEFNSDEFAKALFPDNE